ncbi:MAG: hypothetical protein PHO66_01055 [Eubacteriales bacterium]|nr:hypothetical protein [Eubacteriales bacterium]
MPVTKRRNAPAGVGQPMERSGPPQSIRLIRREGLSRQKCAGRGPAASGIAWAVCTAARAGPANGQANVAVSCVPVTARRFSPIAAGTQRLAPA